jgi:hypothetical protein
MHLNAAHTSILRSSSWQPFLATVIFHNQRACSLSRCFRFALQTKWVEMGTQMHMVAEKETHLTMPSFFFPSSTPIPNNA